MNALILIAVVIGLGLFGDMIASSITEARDRRRKARWAAKLAAYNADMIARGLEPYVSPFADRFSLSAQESAK